MFQSAPIWFRLFTLNPCVTYLDVGHRPRLPFMPGPSLKARRLAWQYSRGVPGLQGSARLDCGVIVMCIYPMDSPIP